MGQGMAPGFDPNEPLDRANERRWRRIFEQEKLAMQHGTAPNDWMTLQDVARQLGDVSYKVLHRHSKADHGFPEPVKTLGRYHLYDYYEVQEWWVLWKKVTSNANGRRHND